MTPSKKRKPYGEGKQPPVDYMDVIGYSQYTKKLIEIGKAVWKSKTISSRP